MTDGRGKPPKERYSDLLQSIRDKWSKMNAKNQKKVHSDILELAKEASEIDLNSINLSDTCIGVLLKIYIEQKTGRRDEISSRYLTKGTNVEPESILMLQELEDEMYEKNTERIFNEYIQGECDIAEEDRITDIKSSWDIFTFIKKTIQDKLDSAYEWQGHGYMWLWNKSRFRNVYVLCNTPRGLIEDEKKRFLYELGSDRADSEAYKLGCSEIEHNCIYDDLLLSERICILTEITFDEVKIERIKARVMECRAWLNNYASKEKKLLDGEKIKKSIDEVLFECRLEIGDFGLCSIERDAKEPTEEQVKDFVETFKETERFKNNVLEVLNEVIKDAISIPLSEEPIVLQDNDSVIPTSDFEPDEDEFLAALEEVGIVPVQNVPVEIVATVSYAPRDYRTQISNLKTDMECMELYAEIKGTQPQEIIDLLRSKRTELATSKSEPVQEIKSTAPKSSITQTGRKNDSHYIALDKLKTGSEVEAYFYANQEIISADKELYRYMEKVGILRERKPLE